MSNYLFSSNVPAGAQVPFQRIVEPAALGALHGVEWRDSVRLKRYEQNWRFFLGQHWTITREDSEPLVTINLLRTIVEKGVTWLVGNGFQQKVPTKLAKAVLPHLSETWDELTDKPVFLIETALMSTVTGDAWVLVMPMDPTPELQRAFPNTRTFLKLHLLGSEQCYPVFDPIDTSKLIAMKVVTVFPIQQQINDPNLRQQVASQGGATHGRFVQTFYPNKIVEEPWQGERREVPNQLGEIPIVHFKNIGLPREYFGLSDMDGGLVDLQKELNEKATDISDVINYQAQPVTVITGAKVKNLVRGPNKIWSGLPADARVTNLTLDSSGTSASLEYIKFIKQSMMETSDLPQAGLGAVLPVSNTSGVAMRTMFQPVIERLKRKKPFFQKGLSDINYFILRWKEVLDGIELPHGFCKNCGGRIVDVVIKDRKGEVLKDRFGRARTRKRCYHADPETGLFIEPEDMRVEFVAQFSFGAEIQEAEQWRLAARMLKQRASFWDPYRALTDDGVIPSQDEFQAALKQEEAAKDTSKKMTPEEQLTLQYKPVKFPNGALTLPEEPENVQLLIVKYNQETGQPLRDAEGRPITEEEELLLVATGCKDPSYFNPYHIEAELLDALPHDEHLDAQLATQLTTAGLWARERAMRYVNVDNPELEMQQVDAQLFTPPDPATPRGGVVGTDVPATALQGMEAGRAAATGGDPNAPTPPGTPMIGKNQGEA